MLYEVLDKKLHILIVRDFYHIIGNYLLNRNSRIQFHINSHLNSKINLN